MDTLADAEGRQVTALTDPDPLQRMDDDGGVIAYAPAAPAAPVADAMAPVEAAEPVSAPVRDPMAEAISKLEFIEEVRPLTRKERREYARLEAKIAKKQLRAARHMPATKAKVTAIASRALAIFDSMTAAAR
jgi:hypothetical protein